jgi:hypothetical protein
VTAAARFPAVRPRELLAGAVVVLGVVLATLAAGNAVRLGEPPQTVLPFARAVVAWGLPALAAYRLAATAALWLAVVRLAPRSRTLALALLGVGWLLWAAWQSWVLLALT